MARQSLSTPYELLVRYSGRPGGLPSPIPLLIAEVPFVLSTNGQGERQPNGNLEKRYYILTYEYTGARGEKVEVRITGDPELGLPFGSGDANIFMALLKIVDERGLEDGHIPDPSAQEIARYVLTTDSRPGGSQIRRIRHALARIAHVRFQTRLVYDPEQIDFAFMENLRRRRPGIHPLAPDSFLRTVEQDETDWVIRYKLVTERTRRQEGELYIDELQVNPALVNEMLGGWVSWIDVPTFTSLAGVVAKRLYQVCAGLTARQAPTPWSFDLEEMEAVCALSRENRPKRNVDLVRKAGEALVEAEVLSDIRCEGGYGDYDIFLRPGSRLQTASRMRGIGLLTPKDHRVLFWGLSRFDVPRDDAWKMIEAKPHQVYRVLQYAFYCKERGDEKKSWPHFVRRAVEEDWSWASDRAFQVWRERVETLVVGGGAEEGAGAEEQQPERPVRQPSRSDVEALDARAAEIYEAIRPALLEATDALVRAGLAHCRGYDRRGTTLVLSATSDLLGEWARRVDGGLVERELGRATAGTLRQIEVLETFYRDEPAGPSTGRRQTTKCS